MATSTSLAALPLTTSLKDTRPALRRQRPCRALLWGDFWVPVAAMLGADTPRWHELHLHAYLSLMSCSRHSTQRRGRSTMRGTCPNARAQVAGHFAGVHRRSCDCSSSTSLLRDASTTQIHTRTTVGLRTLLLRVTPSLLALQGRRHKDSVRCLSRHSCPLTRGMA